MVVIEGADSRIGGNHIRRGDGPLVVFAGPCAEIFDLFLADLHLVLVSGVRNIGRPDQRIFAPLIRNAAFTTARNWRVSVPCAEVNSASQ